jgi:hypothetical protein
MICFCRLLDIALNRFEEIKINLIELIKNIIKLYELDPKKSEIILNNYIDEFNEIKKILIIENAKNLNSLLNKSLKNFQNINDIDIYLKTILQFRIVLSCIKNENFEYKSSLKKQFLEFITTYLDEKNNILLNALEEEKYIAINDNLPQSLQKKLNILFKKSLEEYKKDLSLDNFNKIITLDINKSNDNDNDNDNFINININNNNNLIDLNKEKPLNLITNINKDKEKENDNDYEKDNKETIDEENNTNLNTNININITKNIKNNINNIIELTQEKPNDISLKEKEINSISNNTQNPLINSNSNSNSNMIEIEGLKLKISNSTIILINYFFEVFKMMIICDDSLMPHISDSLSFNVTKYLEIKNETVLLGDGVKKGKLRAITQKEISIVCSNAVIVKKIINIFGFNQLLTAIFSDLKIKIDSIINTCKCKISELFEQT